ncbi:trehalose-phosphatase [Rouxiella silvae]|uniref:Trehalose 6-phosphate phosphatase n=1 Tax=Rouxiella silvae TaxID=1646373 RepID=A0AA40X620_9GAMM|nr:trehalose-phosphatase [Rouxiella silvae]MBF6639175.1 trehalose-phosphatase [Rouxiella silvae]ORJ23090.1 trehalose-phosphatase [Rouxiella silvae]
MTTVTQDNTAETPPLPALEGGRYAFFFDVDGTLAELIPEPDDVTIPSHVLDNMQTLSTACEGAVALVSGRSIEQLDQLASPLSLPMAGVHGAEMRDAQGHLQRTTLPAEIATPLLAMLEKEMSAMPGTLLEAKGMAFALHYRQAMAYQHQVLALAESAIAQFPQLTLQPGKCVVEIKPLGADKGAAIKTFMQQSPFIGRTPVFIGDDLTDEKGFQAVNAMQGISVKVGVGKSHARYRLKQVADVYTWLDEILSLLKQNIEQSTKQNTVGKGSRL